MTLDEFKTIFWWEWTHRLLGRLIGAAFLLPFLWFLWRGWIAAGLRWRLWMIFGLGALQGAVGWWMVASGLDRARRGLAIPAGVPPDAGLRDLRRDRLDAQRLMRARTFAMRRRASARPPCACRCWCCCRSISARWSPALRAGLIYNTWPLIDGAFIPAAARLVVRNAAVAQSVREPLTVQFNHRMMAYLLAAVGSCTPSMCCAVSTMTTPGGGTHAGGARRLAGGARHPDADSSGADRPRADASGDGGLAAYARGAACRPLGCEAPAGVIVHRFQIKLSNSQA